MTSTTRVREALDERLDGLPSVPPELYLAAGRAAQRERRRRRTGAAVGLVAAGLVVATQALPLGSEPGRAREHRPATATTAPTTAPSLSSLRVEPGLGDIDSFTTDDIPEWATEYGNHGPASIAPDGRLWIAPEATVVRSIADPFDGTSAAARVAHSYAVELRWEHPDGGVGEDGLVWSFLIQYDGDTDTFGWLDDPGRWTTDFALWAEDQTSSELDRPSFAERLVQFRDDGSEVLVPGPGVEVVRQVAGVELTSVREQHPRRAAAEVVVDGQTYFVLANGPQHGKPFYEAYEPAVSAPDFDGFLQFIATDFEPQVPAS